MERSKGLRLNGIHKFLVLMILVKRDVFLHPSVARSTTAQAEAVANDLLKNCLSPCAVKSS